RPLDLPDRRTAGVRSPHAGPGGRDDGDVPGGLLPVSAIWRRAALTSSALVFACPPRPHPPSSAPASSTQVRRTGWVAGGSWMISRTGGRPRAACRGLAPGHAPLFRSARPAVSPRRL